MHTVSHSDIKGEYYKQVLLYKSKKEGKDQESIQSSTTADREYRPGK